jgi:hypothetical protein
MASNGWSREEIDEEEYVHGGPHIDSAGTVVVITFPVVL